MYTFKIVGIFFIALGVVSSVVLLLEPFGIPLKTSLLNFWLFWVLCFVGGFLLLALGSRESSTKRIIATAGALLMILALSAATSILLASVSLVPSDNTSSLWPLFLVCMVTGVAAILVSEKWETIAAEWNASKAEEAAVEAEAKAVEAEARAADAERRFREANQRAADLERKIADREKDVERLEEQTRFERLAREKRPRDLEGRRPVPEFHPDLGQESTGSSRPRSS